MIILTAKEITPTEDHAQKPPEQLLLVPIQPLVLESTHKGHTLMTEGFMLSLKTLKDLTSIILNLW